MPTDAEWLKTALDWAGAAERGLPNDMGASLTEDYANYLEYAQFRPEEGPIHQTWFLSEELPTLLETPDKTGQNHLSVRWWQRFAEGQSGIGRVTRFIVWFFS